MQLLSGFLELNYRFGLIRVGRWKVRWRRFLWWASPLRLRWSFRRLKKVSDHPYREYMQLLWPLPRYWPCPPLPPPPRLIFANPSPVLEHYYRHCHVQRQFPLWSRRDTLQRAFFRLYEAICAADDITIGYATEYMFFRPEPEWALHLLADPRTMAAAPSIRTDNTSNTERLAVMARLAMEVEEAFNWRLELGLRRDGTVVERAPDGTSAPWVPEVRPSWANEIDELPELLVLSHGWTWPNHVAADWKPSFNIILHGGALRTV